MKEVSLAPVTEGLRRAAVLNRWFYDEESNRRRGFGSGDEGIVAATEAHAALLDQVDSGDEGVGIVGIYADGLPVGYFSMQYLGPKRRSVAIDLVIENESEADLSFAEGPLHELLEILFKRTKNEVFRVQTETISRRKKWVKFLSSNGFTQEAHHKHAYWVDGNSYDTITLRLLRPAWARMKREKKEEVN